MGKQQLSPEVAKVYTLNTLQPRTYLVAGFGRVDLCNITIEQAEKLVKNGFPYLKEKKVATGKKGAANAETQQTGVEPPVDNAPI